jgi:hypothetical protein
MVLIITKKARGTLGACVQAEQPSLSPSSDARPTQITRLVDEFNKAFVFQ